MRLHCLHVEWVDMVKGIQIKGFQQYRRLLFVTDGDHQHFGNILTIKQSILRWKKPHWPFLFSTFDALTSMTYH
jgi:hypothetical protein